MGHPDLAIVTGAFSYTGGNVARRLIDLGVRVRTLSRQLTGANPLGDRVGTAPLDCSDPHALRNHMNGAGVLHNTYWIRYARGRTTFDRAVENTRIPVDAPVARMRRSGMRMFLNPVRARSIPARAEEPKTALRFFAGLKCQCQNKVGAGGGEPATRRT